MSSNSIGRFLRLTTFGESHGPAIGGVLDGFPPNFKIDLRGIRKQMQRRKPGQSSITTSRNEEDEVEFLSGIYKGKTLGTPIAFIVRNKDAQSKDYDRLKNIFRPGHADYTYLYKYENVDHRGGGRASARNTAPIVVAGEIARQYLNQELKDDVEIHAFVSQVGKISLDKNLVELDLDKIESNPVRCPDKKTAKQMIAAIEKAKSENDSLGGVITCVIKKPDFSLGDPMFHKLQADLAAFCFSLPAVHGFEYGSGFASAAMKGSEHNDQMFADEERVFTDSNNAGGILGGISNGENIIFRVAFKPPSSIGKKQFTVTKELRATTLELKGRHDPCVVPRAVPIIESIAAFVLVDFHLANRALGIDQ